MRAVALAVAILAAATSASFADTIRVGMSGGYFPFTFVKQDKLQGFEIDFMNALAGETGDEVEFVTMSFSGLIGALQAGPPERIFTDPKDPRTRAFLRKVPGTG